MLTLDAIYKAKTVLQRTVRRTPIFPTQGFNDACHLHLKAENLQLTGSFKVRGSAYKMSQLSEEEKQKGVIACSAGNHAQGVALAAQRFGVKSTICLPSGAPVSKVEATREYGAEICMVQGVYDDAYAEAVRLQKERDLTFIHPFDDEAVIAGQGTVGLEIMEDLPEVEVVLVPIGGGGLAAGVALAVKSLNPDVKVYGVQAEGAPSMQRSLEAHEILQLPKVNTVADGIAVKRPGTHTFELCEHYLDGIVTVSEDEICAAILALIERPKLVAEGAGAVAVAAAMYNKVPLEGKTVCAIVSGGNIDVTILNRVITRGLLKSYRITDMLIEMADHPGSLLDLTQVIMDHGANIISVHHERSGENREVTSCNLRVTLETRNQAQIKAIQRDITASGYTIIETKN